MQTYSCDSIAQHDLHSSRATAHARKLRLVWLCLTTPLHNHPTHLPMGGIALPGPTNTLASITCSPVGTTAHRSSFPSSPTKPTPRPRLLHVLAGGMAQPKMAGPNPSTHRKVLHPSPIVPNPYWPSPAVPTAYPNLAHSNTQFSNDLVVLQPSPDYPTPILALVSICRYCSLAYSGPHPNAAHTHASRCYSIAQPGLPTASALIGNYAGTLI